MTRNVTPAEYKCLVAKRTKYGAVRTVIDGITFDSKAEAKHYLPLKMQADIGQITALKIHPRFPIVINERHVCDVVLDFSFVRDAEQVFLDVKGRDNALSKLKRKLLFACYGINVTLVK